MELVLTESGNFKDISHLFHFIELLFVGLIKIEQNGWTPHNITKVNIPHWPHVSWKGKVHPHNEWILNRVFPSAHVVHTPYEPGPTTVVVDRADCPKGEVNKMWIKYMRYFDEWKWARLINPIPRDPAQSENKVVVTYVDRQNDPKGRCLPTSVHDNLVKHFTTQPGIKFLHLKMENFKFQEQVNFMQKTDLLIGVHGNGLTHAAFMPPHSSVCEIFPEGMKFQWDYYTLAKMMGHEYMCIFNSMPTPPYMFNNIREIVCQTCQFDPCIFSGLTKQIKEERIN